MLKKHLINIDVENVCCLLCLWRPLPIQSLLIRHLFEIEIFCNIIIVITVTFDQFKASFQNRTGFRFSLENYGI